MIVLTKLVKNSYRDSVFLMQISSAVGKMEGVCNVAVLIGSDQNKRSLEDIMLLEGEIREASANDLMIAVSANAESIAQRAISRIEEMLTVHLSTKLMETAVATTLMSARAIQPDSNWVLLSIPGQFVKREAVRALRAGLNVMIFSSNVPISEEVKIKKLASESGLVVMGPDCGTAIINGCGFGFANRVRKGPVGLVGAAGTGIQEIISLIHKQGSGITHAIGTGTNDVSAEVGGVTMLEGIRLLDQNDDTKVIVVVSKPTSPDVQNKVIQAASSCHKPVILNLLGGQIPEEVKEGLTFSRTLEEAALHATATVLANSTPADPFLEKLEENVQIAESEYSKLGPDQRYIRGLFSGGTLCNEACIILADLGLDVHTNSSLPSAKKLQNARKSVGNSLVDTGAEEFTAGKPHPMIEPSMRESRLLEEAADNSTAVILLDFVLGYGAHRDPVGALLQTIKQAKSTVVEEGRYLPIVASVCGTEGDPQGFNNQVDKLEQAGVVVMPSNAQASKMTALIALKGKAKLWTED